MIKDLHRRGVAISEIARITGHDRKTIRAILNGPVSPPPRKHKVRARKLDPFAPYLEKRIEEDEDLGHAADRVRLYVKNVIAQFHAMCESQAAHQRNQVMLCEGRAQAAEQAVAQLEKDITFERAATARRDELDAERRAKEEEGATPEPAPAEPARKARADKGMPRKRKAG